MHLSRNSEVHLEKGTTIDRSKGVGISVGAHSRLYLENSVVNLSEDTGIICAGKGSLVEAARSKITLNANCGIAIQDGGNGLIQQCEVNDNGTSGVLTAGGAMCTLQDSMISGNTENGLVVQEGSELTAERCAVDSSSTGILVSCEGTVATLERCTIERCTSGVAVKALAQAVIRRNRIRRNTGEGIKITGARAGNTAASFPSPNRLS
jgi:hypothetical protein